jgi:hypothetical protein
MGNKDMKVNLNKQKTLDRTPEGRKICQMNI